MEKRRHLRQTPDLATTSRRQEPGLYPDNLRPDEIYMNMGYFLEEEQLFISELLSQAAKPNQQPPRPEDIRIVPYVLTSELYVEEPHHFFRDTDCGVTLYQGDRHYQDGACIGFELLTPDQIFKLMTYRRLIEEYNDSLSHRYPVISQLQGPTFRDLKSVEPVLKNLRWERMLVHLISFWAKKAGFPHIYILPGEHSTYYKPGNNPELAQRLTRRYNCTAKKCGFTRDPETGLYRKDLGVSKI